MSGGRRGWTSAGHGLRSSVCRQGLTWSPRLARVQRPLWYVQLYLALEERALEGQRRLTGEAALTHNGEVVCFPGEVKNMPFFIKLNLGELPTKTL